MSRKVVKVSIGLLAAVSVAGIAIAQDTGEVTVQASRVVKKTIGTTASGIPIQDVSLSYGVSTAGLDLSSSSGAAELKKRVVEAAKAACKELGRQYPRSKPEDEACAKAAADKAMARVDELVAGAHK